MSLKCTLGRHDFRERCVCSRCSATSHDFSSSCLCSRCAAAVHREITLLPILDPPLAPDTPHLLPVVQKALARHRLDRCRCMRCGATHAWILAREDELADPSGAIIAPYRLTYVCIICGHSRSEDISRCTGLM